MNLLDMIDSRRESKDRYSIRRRAWADNKYFSIKTMRAYNCGRGINCGAAEESSNGLRKNDLIADDWETFDFDEYARKEFAKGWKNPESM